MTQEQIEKYEYYKNKKQRLEEELYKYNKINEMIKTKNKNIMFYDLECYITVKLYDCGSDGNDRIIKDEFTEDITKYDVFFSLFYPKIEKITKEIEECDIEIKKFRRLIMAKFEFKEKGTAYEIVVYILMILMVLFITLLIAAIVKGAWIILFKL